MASPLDKDRFMHRKAGAGNIERAEEKRLKEVAKIRERLTIAKLTLTDIDRRYGLPSGTAGNAVHEPHIAGERAIAAALRSRPHLLWPSRYFGNGQRKSPQPAINYRYARRSAEKPSEAA